MWPIFLWPISYGSYELYTYKSHIFGQMFRSSYAEAVDTVPKPDMKPVVYEKKMRAIDKQIASELPPPYCKLGHI